MISCINKCCHADLWSAIIRVVNLLQNALFSKFYNFLSSDNCQLSQSTNSIIDHPKMPRFSKRANLLKELEAIAKSHTMKAYLQFCLDEEDYW